MIQADGTITRPYKWEVLGTVQDYPTRKLALRALEARLSTINSPTYIMRYLEVQDVLRGFIDESHDGDNPPKVFQLSCIVTSDAGCLYFGMAWEQLLESKNEELRKQSRQEISRFHAADFNNYQGDFKGWTPSEQKDFSQRIVRVFERNPVHIHSWNMPLQLLVQEFPETASNPIGFAYITLLTHMMDQIGDTTLSIYKEDVISLHHDRCDYDAVSQEQFMGLVAEDSTFKHRNRFASLTSETWQDCLLLQPADLIAYENLKESMRVHTISSAIGFACNRGAQTFMRPAIVN